jgi:hypothetical protein
MRRWKSVLYEVLWAVLETMCSMGDDEVYRGLDCRLLQCT